ncbi:MAG TPA: HEAT repeat domain-containing protein [Oscillatoriales cyanobacterium M59_W2019_021]|nr:MAG: HEAT repeat domain-containing protein [Cyanobacteria bacterium J055]HIK32052.1 HEAT repeat domain-containing protein [Oscillatoriales cyanobacterium M4454_W2019_049]HIK49694.1 HEAT repeat domain-containing protein [Oscillatoriales cyanobacterium M59_W2019_021]
MRSIALLALALCLGDTPARVNSMDASSLPIFSPVPDAPISVAAATSSPKADGVFSWKSIGSAAGQHPHWVWWTGGVGVLLLTGSILYRRRKRHCPISPTPDLADPIPFTHPDDSIATEARAESVPDEPPTSADEDPEVQNTTPLRRIGIVETLIRDLHSRDPVKRRQAIWELGQCGDSRAIQPLVDLTLDSDSAQRSLILAALSEIGVRTLKPMNRALAVSLQDENPEVRKNAIRDLTRVYDLMGQVAQLLNHASADGDREVSETARWAMGKLDRLHTLAGRDFSALPTSESPSEPPEEQ